MHKEKEKKVLKECAVAGWKYTASEEILSNLYEGEELYLIRETDNSYDRNAIVVAVQQDEEYDVAIGYVPRSENELIAKMMDMGWDKAFSAELTTVKENEDGPYHLRMTIYVVNKNTVEEDKKQHTFALLLNKQGHKYLSQMLFDEGFAYFRWGGFPPWERTLPNKGDKVVFIASGQKKSELYLMQVLLNDEKIISELLNDPGMIGFPDDCAPFILTNIKGPVIVKQGVLDFLESENINKYQPEKYLPGDMEEKLISLFK